jgi:hypothetical protein
MIRFSVRLGAGQVPRPQGGYNEAQIHEIHSSGREPRRTRNAPGTVQGPRKALEEQKRSDGTAEEQLAAERRLNATALELATATMGAEYGRDDRDQDDGG